MENDIPTQIVSKKKKNDFKVIPVLETTRERMKSAMMKMDIYDSYINKKLDRVEELEKQVETLEKQLAVFTQVK
jgi:hypothetical protein